VKLLKGRGKTKKVAAASSALSGTPSDILTAAPPAAALVVGQHTERRREGHLGMQGYAPGVFVSRNRIRCEGCKALVFASTRHICIYNAHHHIGTLTAAERDQLIADLKALGVSEPIKQKTTFRKTNS
jgi:hypothetical protein